MYLCVVWSVEGSTDDYQSMTIEKVSEEEHSQVEVHKAGRQTVFEERITRVEETEREVIEEKSIRKLIRNSPSFIRARRSLYNAYACSQNVAIFFTFIIDISRCIILISVISNKNSQVHYALFLAIPFMTAHFSIVSLFCLSVTFVLLCHVAAVN